MNDKTQLHPILYHLLLIILYPFAYFYATFSFYYELFFNRKKSKETEFTDKSIKNIKVNYNGKEEIISPFEFNRRVRLGLLPILVTNDIYKTNYNEQKTFKI